MKIIFKILNKIFVILGVIFLLIIIIASYFWVKDPLELKSLIPTEVSPIAIIKTTISGDKIEIDNIDKNPLLTEDQEAQLESIGVDPATLPSEITPQMSQCLIQKLGEKRANEIIGGSSPTPADFLKSSSCLN